MNPPPPRDDTVRFKLEDGSWVQGWANYDQNRGWRYFTRSLDAPRPSRGITSRWDIEGVLEIYPVRWEWYFPPQVTIPNSPIARREAEVMLKRAILTDGTLLRSGQGLLRSSWDATLHNDGLALIDQVNLEIFERFIPEAFDNDNYLIGMDWLARINKKAKGFWDLNQEQWVVIFRAYGFSFRSIGSRREVGDVSDSRARQVYKQAIDRVWGFALELGPEAGVRRLPRSLWNL